MSISTNGMLTLIYRWLIIVETPYTLQEFLLMMMLNSKLGAMHLYFVAVTLQLFA